MTAVLSQCRSYRYKLYRDVDMHGEKIIAFFGINPSTADETEDDATVRKWRGFSQRNGARRFIVANVFAYRATDVSELANVEDPVGPKNMHHVLSAIQEADYLVPCWGSRSKLPKSLWHNLDTFLEMLLRSGKPVFCFGKTKNNDPRHPLMLGYDTTLETWE